MASYEKENLIYQTCNNKSIDYISFVLFVAIIYLYKTQYKIRICLNIFLVKGHIKDIKYSLNKYDLI